MEYIYVCHFSSGHIKVGHSKKPSRRIATHAERVRCVGVDLIESKSFPCIGEGHQAERALIKWCADRASTSHFNEWFGGVNFAEACDAAALVAAREFPVDKKCRELIKQLGGPTSVARALGWDGVSQVRRVSNWSRRGIPEVILLKHPRIFKQKPALTQSSKGNFATESVAA